MMNLNFEEPPVGQTAFTAVHQSSQTTYFKHFSFLERIKREDSTLFLSGWNFSKQLVLLDWWTAAVYQVPPPNAVSDTLLP